MDDKLKLLLDKINLDKENYDYFSNAKLTKIKVSSKDNSWNVFIKNDNPLPLDIIEELESKKTNLDENISSITFVFDIENIDIDIYYSYYKYVLNKLKDELKILGIFENSLKVEDGLLRLEVTNDNK